MSVNYQAHVWHEGSSKTLEALSQQTQQTTVEETGRNSTTIAHFVSHYLVLGCIHLSEEALNHLHYVQIMTKEDTCMTKVFNKLVVKIKIANTSLFVCINVKLTFKNCVRKFCMYTGERDGPLVCSCQFLLGFSILNATSDGRWIALFLYLCFQCARLKKPAQ